MASSPTLPPNRHIEFKKGGWGAAILTTAAVVGVFLTAFYIHTQTYRHPRDPMMRQMGGAADHGSASSHAPEPAHGGQAGAAAGAAHGAEAPAAKGAAPAAGH